MLQVISLAHFAITYARGWTANAINPRAQQASEIDRLRAHIAILQEQNRIKDARMAIIQPQRRPHYTPVLWMAILELKAAQGWSLAQTAKVFLIEPDTVASWLKRLDESGPSALVRTSEPVNKFPGVVSYIVQRLKVLCPALGKVKIAQVLARAGLHLGVSTVGRMLKGRSDKAPSDEPQPSGELSEDLPTAEHVVTAKRPNHVWHVDLTAVPLTGFWVPWLPFALPQCWPFCWWLGEWKPTVKATGFGKTSGRSDAGEPRELRPGALAPRAVRGGPGRGRHGFAPPGATISLHDFTPPFTESPRILGFRPAKETSCGTIRQALDDLKAESLYRRLVGIGDRLGAAR